MAKIAQNYHFCRVNLFAQVVSEPPGKLLNIL